MRRVIITRTHSGYTIEYYLGEANLFTETISASEMKPLEGMPVTMPAFPINHFPRIRNFIS